LRLPFQNAFFVPVVPPEPLKRVVEGKAARLVYSFNLTGDAPTHLRK
jgi:hypothetical protein